MCSLDRKCQNSRVFTDFQASYHPNFHKIGIYKSFLITTVIKYNLMGHFSTKGSVDLIYYCSVFLVQSLVLGNFSTGKIQYGGQLLLLPRHPWRFLHGIRSSRLFFVWEIRAPRENRPGFWESQCEIARDWGWEAGII